GDFRGHRRRLGCCTDLIGLSVGALLWRCRSYILAGDAAEHPGGGPRLAAEEHGRRTGYPNSNTPCSGIGYRGRCQADDPRRPPAALCLGAMEGRTAEMAEVWPDPGGHMRPVV